MKLTRTGLLGAAALLATAFFLRSETSEPALNAVPDDGSASMIQSPQSSQGPPQSEPTVEAKTTQLPGANPPPPPTPGNDLCLGGSWEPTIAVDPLDQDTIACVQFRTIRVSFDGGDNFLAADTLAPTAPPGISFGGDPSLGFNSRGMLFLTILGSPSSPSMPGRDVYLYGWTRVGNSFVQTIGPINVTAAAGMGAPANADKEWLAVDWFVTSPNRDALHVAWSRLDSTPDWTIMSTSSADNGATWTPAAQLSIPADGTRPWGVHNTVDLKGDVYVTYHTQPGFLTVNPSVPDGISGGVAMHRSTDGGASYTRTAADPFKPGQADATWNVQNATNGVVAGNNSWWQGNCQAPVLADPTEPGTLYVVSVDDPDDNVDAGDPADIFIVRTTDWGATWDPRVQVNDGPVGAFSIFPAAAIDPMTGAIVVSWYDNRTLNMGTSGQFLLDLRAASSSSGGLFWFPSADVNDGQFDPGLSQSCRFCCAGSCGAGVPPTMRIGEYNGVAMGECTAHFVWADNGICNNSTSTLNMFYDRDPEMGGDLTPPVVTCPPNVSLGCLDSTDPQNTGYAEVTDNCDLNPSLIFVDEVIAGSCPPGTVLETIKRHWSSTDAAGNFGGCTQVITVVDFDAPQLFNIPLPLVIETEAGCVLPSDPQIQAWIAPITAIDECSNADLQILMPDIFLGACGDGKVHFITVATSDECGNGTFEVIKLTVKIPPGRGTPFCFGTQAACPCGNNGLPGHGCDIAQQTGGVCLNDVNFLPNGSGGGTVQLMGVGFPLGTNPTVVAIRSPLTQAPSPLGDGVLCLGGQVHRLATQAAADGKVLFNHVHTQGAGRFYYQLWFRNPPAAFCNAQAAFNLSNGLELQWK